MSFRDDHDAAITRASALDAEAKKLRAEREELKAERDQIRLERDLLSAELARRRGDVMPSDNPHSDLESSSDMLEPERGFFGWLGRHTNSSFLKLVVIVGMWVLPVALLILVAYLLDPRGCVR